MNEVYFTAFSKGEYNFAPINCQSNDLTAKKSGFIIDIDTISIFVKSRLKFSTLNSQKYLLILITKVISLQPYTNYSKSAFHQKKSSSDSVIWLFTKTAQNDNNKNYNKNQISFVVVWPMKAVSCLKTDKTK